MIDFRYHLVSLISVFLALAVGVVLGAGPLQNSIGTALQDQVSELRTDRDAVRAELDTTRQIAERSDAFIDATSPSLVADTLKGQRVAVVALPGAAPDDVVSVDEELAAAGAEVNAHVYLTEAWIDAERLQYRTTLAGQMLGYLDPAPAAEAGTDGVLANALAQGLSRTAPTPEGQPSAPDAPLAEEAATLISMLSGGDTPLVTVETQPTTASTSVIVVGPRAAEVAANAGDENPKKGSENSDGAAEEAMAKAVVSTVRAIDQVIPHTVVVGAAATPQDIVTRIRGDESLAGSVTTVDSVGLTLAPVSSMLALAQDLQGRVEHYGFAESAKTPAALRPPAASQAPDAAAGNNQ